MALEKPAASPPTLRQVFADFGGLYAVNALVAFVFAASGPVAIILAVGTRGGLSESDLASWIFGAFFLNGLVSIAFCWWYRAAAGVLLDDSRHGAGRAGARAPAAFRR